MLPRLQADKERDTTLVFDVQGNLINSLAPFYFSRIFYNFQFFLNLLWKARTTFTLFFQNLKWIFAEFADSLKGSWEYLSPLQSLGFLRDWFRATGVGKSLLAETSPRLQVSCITFHVYWAHVCLSTLVSRGHLVPGTWGTSPKAPARASRGPGSKPIGRLAGAAVHRAVQSAGPQGWWRLRCAWHPLCSGRSSLYLILQFVIFSVDVKRPGKLKTQGRLLSGLCPPHPPAFRVALSKMSLFPVPATSSMSRASPPPEVTAGRPGCPPPSAGKGRPSDEGIAEGPAPQPWASVVLHVWSAGVRLLAVLGMRTCQHLSKDPTSESLMWFRSLWNYGRKTS